MIKINFVREDEPVFKLIACVGMFSFATISFIPSTGKYALSYERPIKRRNSHVKHDRDAYYFQAQLEMFDAAKEAMDRVWQLLREELTFDLK